MIHDQNGLTEIGQEWAAVKKLCSGSHRQLLVPGGSYINETPPESFYNLPFLLAYGVLDQVLSELIDQDTIQASGTKNKRLQLGEKMRASKGALLWQDYDLINAGKTARNELAHEAKLLNRDDCFKYISAVEIELKAWGII